MSCKGDQNESKQVLLRTKAQSSVRRCLIIAFLLFLAVCNVQCQSRVPAAKPISMPSIIAQRYDLVEVRELIPDAIIELRYGSKNNLMSQPLYPKNMPCLLYRPTAEKLAVAAQTLRQHGYRIKVWDAWRPTEVQRTFHQHFAWAGLFADPAIRWSSHCTATAVDLTLTDLDGIELKMPTDFDVGGPSAASIYIGNDAGVKQRLHLLHVSMWQAGFLMLDSEWWHFDDKDYHDASARRPILSAADMNIELPIVRAPKIKR